MAVATERFLRYGPDIERADPNFEQTLKTIIEASQHYVAGSVAAEGLNLAVRDAHATGFGLARGEVEILGGLPQEYAQGIYATPGRHEAMVRFSSGSAHTGPDALLGPVCGMGLKLFGIAGPTLLEDEPDSGTFDYANINAPIFFCNTVEQYVIIQKLFLQIGAPPAEETREEKRTRLHRFLYTWVTGAGTLPPEEWMWDELGAFLSLKQVKPVNLLLSTFWTMASVRHGDYIAKVRVAPAQEYADRVTRRTLDLASAREVFRAGGGAAGAPLRVRHPGSALRRSGAHAGRGRDGGLAGDALAIRHCRQTAPAAAGHRRGGQLRAHGRHFDDALARHGGAPAAGQHHARAQGGLSPGIHPAPRVEPPGAQGAEESRGGLRRLGRPRMNNGEPEE
jgi:hypothetical protein